MSTARAVFEFLADHLLAVVAIVVLFAVGPRDLIAFCWMLFRDLLAAAWYGLREGLHRDR